ncbi:hypothetical protein XBFFL1_2330002 [Xenorhabdus bovienii str. feltiae Florida]|nr:hypothetical protein XBFFR1_2280003 [Xenorhabdus bovienii str. feltiae France]CDG92824.1 hypothetical protein XBFFL1_2330002 [Xenorhabdus bovienii str. feltiae Florida]
MVFHYVSLDIATFLLSPPTFIASAYSIYVGSFSDTSPANTKKSKKTSQSTDYQQTNSYCYFLL